MAVEPEEPRSGRGLPALIIGTAVAGAATAIGAVVVRLRGTRGTRVELDLHVDRPVRDVFAFVSDTRNEVQWLSGAVERRKLTPGPIGVGTRTESTDRIGPWTVQTIEEITELEPDRRLRIGVTGSSEGTYAMETEPVGNGTMLRLDATIRGHGIMALFDVLPDALMRRMWGREAARLKELLESRSERLSSADDADDRKEPATISVESEAEVPGG